MIKFTKGILTSEPAAGEPRNRCTEELIRLAERKVAKPHAAMSFNEQAAAPSTHLKELSGNRQRHI